MKPGAFEQLDSTCTAPPSPKKRAERMGRLKRHDGSTCTARLAEAQAYMLTTAQWRKLNLIRLILKPGLRFKGEGLKPVAFRRLWIN